MSFLRLRASKRPSASAVRQKLAKGVLQRAVDVPDPVAEFQALREDRDLGSDLHTRIGKLALPCRGAHWRKTGCP